MCNSQKTLQIPKQAWRLMLKRIYCSELIRIIGVYAPSRARSFGVLCCLTTPCLRMDFWHEIRQLYSQQVPYYVHYNYILLSHLLSHCHRMYEVRTKNELQSQLLNPDTSRGIVIPLWIVILL